MKNLIKNPRFWTGVIVVIILITIIVQSRKPETKKIEEEQPSNQQTEQQEPAKTTISSPNIWEGVLKSSDNKTKGNLMLITTDKKIYIKTSRDFTNLLDKKVAVTYEGTTDSFQLGDIVESKE